MPSEKLRNALLARTDLSADQAAVISERDGWRLIYSLPKKDRAQKLPAVCLSGFRVSERPAIEAEINASGIFRIVQNMSSLVDYLCVGETPGPQKLADAQRWSAIVLTWAEMQALMADGVLPDRLMR